MNRDVLRPARPLLITFVILTALIVAGKNWLLGNGVEEEVVLGGNVLLFVVSLTGFLITSRSFRSANPNVFIRSMYGSFIVKFFVVAITAFIYIQSAGKEVNKPGLMFCAGLYILYTGLETKALVKMLKTKKNA